MSRSGNTSFKLKSCDKDSPSQGFYVTVLALPSCFAVRSFGTENRDAPKKVPPREEVYEYIVFRGKDIKDLLVCEVPRTTASSSNLPPDPAIVQVIYVTVNMPVLRRTFRRDDAKMK